jgi:hypothetical protein
VEEKRAKQLIRLFRLSRRELYVNCWHAGSTESLAMWDLYGKGSGIVAVKSTVERLKEVVAIHGQPVFISKTRYIDWNDAPGLDNVLVACSRKDLSYRHESEVRVLLMGFTKSPARRKLGVHLQVDVKRLITEVIVGPREQKWVVNLVRAVMKKYALPQEVVASNRLRTRR